MVLRVEINACDINVLFKVKRHIAPRCGNPAQVPVESRHTQLDGMVVQRKRNINMREREHHTRGPSAKQGHSIFAPQSTHQTRTEVSCHPADPSLQTVYRSKRSFN